MKNHYYYYLDDKKTLKSISLKVGVPSYKLRFIFQNVMHTCMTKNVLPL